MEIAADQMKKQKLIHASFDVIDDFIPRIPKSTSCGEDETIPRICVAPSIYDCLRAMPHAAETIKGMQICGLPVILHAYYLKSGHIKDTDEIKTYVPDAEFNNEKWIIERPEKVFRMDYELTNVYFKDGKDPNGKDICYPVCYDINRAKHQDNWVNLAKRMEVPKDWIPEFIERFKEITNFRTLMCNMTKEFFREMLDARLKEEIEIER